MFTLVKWGERKPHTNTEMTSASLVYFKNTSTINCIDEVQVPKFHFFGLVDKEHRELYYQTR